MASANALEMPRVEEAKVQRPGGKRNKPRRPGKKIRSPRRSGSSGGGEVEIPIDVGVGPLGLVPNGPAFSDQFMHGALTLSIAAVVNQEVIRKNQDKIPPRFKNQALKMKEARIKPLWLGLIPAIFVISPAFLNTGIYGAIWHPIGFGLALSSSPVRLSVHADLAFAYLFMHSRTLPEPTHFLRPGLSGNITLEVPLGQMAGFSLGWMSDVFIPQPLGAPPWAVLPLESSLWHLGGPFFKLHFRFPYRTRL
jgi:hypothetical protein